MEMNECVSGWWLDWSRMDEVVRMEVVVFLKKEVMGRKKKKEK